MQRPSFARLAVRRARRQATTQEEKEACDKVLRDDDLLAALSEELESRHAAAGVGADGKIVEFLKWLLQYVVEHGDEILALILTLVALF